MSLAAHHEFILKLKGFKSYPENVNRLLTRSVHFVFQVNHSPSFTTDSQLDREVKDALLYDTLVLINLGACDRRKITKEDRRRVKDRLQQNSTREAR